MAELCLEYTEHLMLLINVITSYYIYLDSQEGIQLRRRCCRGWMLLASIALVTCLTWLLLCDVLQTSLECWNIEENCLSYQREDLPAPQALTLGRML